MFIETTLKDSNKVKRNRNYVLKCNLHLHFLIQQKVLISSKNTDANRTQRMCHMIYIFFGYFIVVGYVTDFREGVFFAPQSMSSPKKAHPK